MADDVEKIIEEGLVETTAEALPRVAEGDLAALKISAYEYLLAVEQRMLLYEAVEKADTLRSKITNYYNAMRQDEQMTRDILSLMAKFENDLNSFLGRSIMLTYVSDTGQVYFTGEENVGEVYQNIVTKNRGRGNVSGNKLINEIENISKSKLEMEIQEIINKSVSERQDVYTTAVQRLLSPSKNGGKPNRYYWYLPSIDWSQKTNIGRIGESYFAAVVAEDPGITNGDIETSLYNLNAGIRSENIAGALQGDVTFDAEGRIQFAVKAGASFSTEMVGPSLKIATNIQIMQEKELKDALKSKILGKELTSIKGAATNAANDLAKKVNEEAKNRIKENYKLDIVIQT